MNQDDPVRRIRAFEQSPRLANFPGEGKEAMPAIELIRVRYRPGAGRQQEHEDVSDPCCKEVDADEPEVAIPGNRPRGVREPGNEQSGHEMAAIPLTELLPGSLAGPLQATCHELNIGHGLPGHLHPRLSSSSDEKTGT